MFGFLNKIFGCWGRKIRKKNKVFGDVHNCINAGTKKEAEETRRFNL